MKRALLIVGVLLGLGVSTLTFPASGSNVSLQTVIREISSEVYPDEAMDFMRRLYSTDRWSTFPKYAETAEYLKGVMTGMGLQQVEILAAPADGTSQFGY